MALVGTTIGGQIGGPPNIDAYQWAYRAAAVIAFMASMENYNTTMFAKGGSCTFATEIGAMARNPNGHPPVINAVGTVIILVTVLAATAHTILSRREARG